MTSYTWKKAIPEYDEVAQHWDFKYEKIETTVLRYIDIG
jgi:hypothetical protein